MVFPRFSCLIFFSQFLIGHTKQFWKLRVKGISKLGALKKLHWLLENVATSISAKKTDLEWRKMADNSNGDRTSKVKTTSDLVHSFVIRKKQVK